MQYFPLLLHLLQLKSEVVLFLCIYLLPGLLLLNNFELLIWYPLLDLRACFRELPGSLLAFLSHLPLLARLASRFGAIYHLRLAPGKSAAFFLALFDAGSLFSEALWQLSLRILFEYVLSEAFELRILDPLLFLLRLVFAVNGPMQPLGPRLLIWHRAGRDLHNGHFKFCNDWDAAPGSLILFHHVHLAIDFIVPNRVSDLM